MASAVIVLDDEERLRNKLEKILLKHPNVDQVVTYNSADKLISELDMLKQTSPDIFILDINMPGNTNGIDALKKVKAEMPESTVYMFTSSENSVEHDLCRRLGAEDVIVKQISSALTKAAINGIVSGVLG